MLFWFLVSFALLSFAQPPPGTCEEFSGIAPLSQCHTIVDYPVFVPANKTQADLDQLASQKTGAFRLGLTSSQCTEEAMKFICAEAYRRCTPIPTATGSVIAFPSQTCRIRCTNFLERCIDSLEQFNADVPNCNAINPNNGLPNFPETGNSFILPNGADLTLQCNNPNRIGNWSELPRATCYGRLTPEDTPLSRCSLVLDYDVYIPEGMTVRAIDSLASVRNALARTSSVSRPCADAMMRFVCSEAFRRCSFGSVVSNIPQVLLPSSSCYENCWSFRDRCDYELSSLARFGLINYVRPNCEVASSNLIRQPQYPLEFSTFFFAAARTFINVSCTYPEITQPYAPYCEPFAGFPEECRSVVDWNVFIPVGSSQKQLAARARVQMARIQAAPSSCREFSLRLSCASIFLKCDSFPITPAVSAKLPSFVCQSFCLETKETCEALTKGKVDCEQLTPNGLQLYPENGTITTLPDREAFIPCHIPEYITDYPPVEECPYPMTLTDDEEFVCSIICPTPVFTKGQYLARLIVNTILAYLGIAAGLFTFISLSLHPLKRTFPKNVINFQVLAATLMVIAFLIPHWLYDGGVPFEEVWCVNKFTKATGSHPPCGTESYFLFNFSFSLIIWYFFVSVFMVRAVLNLPLSLRLLTPLHILLHIIAWGVPVAIWIPTIATGNILSFGNFPCFLNADKWGRYFQEVWFWYPVTVLLMFGLALTAFATISVIKKLGRKGIKKQIRVILYLLYNFCANIWIVFYHYYLFGRREDFVSATQSWAQCSATSLDECEKEGTIEFELYIIQGIVWSSQPLCISLILLTDPEIWLWWRDIFRKYILREEIDDRIEAMQRVKAIQRQIKEHKNTGSDTSLVSNSDWGAGE